MKAWRIGNRVLMLGTRREARELVLAAEALAERLAEPARRNGYDKLRARRLMEIADPIDEAQVDRG